MRIKKYDIWAPAAQCHEFRQTYAANLPHAVSKRFQIEDQATHAFCAFQDESLIMAKRVFSDMKEAFDQQQQQQQSPKEQDTVQQVPKYHIFYSQNIMY